MSPHPTRGDEVRRFAEGPRLIQDGVALRVKYERLLEVAQLASGSAREVRSGSGTVLDSSESLSPLLRGIARDFPGALREAELAGPEVCARRLQACDPTWLGRTAEVVWQSGRSVAPLPTGLDEEQQDGLAVLLWGALHPLLQDLLQARRGMAPGRNLGDVLPRLAPTGRARWPQPEVRSFLAELPARPRTAYLWLAWQTGFDVVTLQRILFTRIGSWARRDGDPGWAHSA